VATAAAVVMLAGSAAAQNPTETLTVSATVAARATLTISAATISFGDADPDVTPLLTAAPLTVTAKARVGQGEAVSLTVEATTPFEEGGGGQIPIGNLEWTGGGSIAAGTAANAPVALGSWTNSGNRTGTQTYTLVNDWAYATGSYSVTMTYTLTVP
jgi:hypothetical protein